MADRWRQSTCAEIAENYSLRRRLERPLHGLLREARLRVQRRWWASHPKPVIGTGCAAIVWVGSGRYELRLFAIYIWVTVCVPGFKGFLYLDAQRVCRHEPQAAGHLQEDPVTRTSHISHLISHVLPDTLRWSSLRCIMIVPNLESPYVTKPHRLGDVIAALQVMGTYRYSARSVESWAELLGEKPRSADGWLEIFNDHPEFFRAGLEDEGLHTLALRRAQPRVYDTKTNEEITVAQYKDLPADGRSHISRRPLTSQQIASLVETAIKLQSQAFARRQELRWWVPHAMSIATLLLGLVVGAVIKSK